MWACETHAKRISFCFEAKKFFWPNRRTLVPGMHLHLQWNRVTLLVMSCYSFADLQIAKQNCGKAKVSADFEAKLFKFRVTTEDVLYCSVWQEWQLKPCSSFITYTQLYIQAGSADKRTVLFFQRVQECTEGMYPRTVVGLGIPFYVKKLFTRNIVTDVTDGYYIVITVVTT